MEFFNQLLYFEGKLSYLIQKKKHLYCFKAKLSYLIYIYCWVQITVFDPEKELCNWKIQIMTNNYVVILQSTYATLHILSYYLTIPASKIYPAYLLK